MVFRVLDAARRRSRLAHADIVDGMPDEIPNLPSHDDGSTDPAWPKRGGGPRLDTTGFE